jgi:signal transduction histidine kinase
MTVRAEQDRSDPSVVVWLPVGRDAALVCALLAEANLFCAPCRSLEEVCAALDTPTTGLAILAEEAIRAEAIGIIRDTLARQPTWSHLPMIVLTGGGTSTEASLEKWERMRALGSLTLLERPLRKVTLLAAVRSALESRQRQWQTRDHIQELQEAHQQLAQANSDLQQFAFAASHDLQEPLRMVNAFTQLLLKRLDETDTQAQEFAGYIRTGVERMDLLLRDLLLYSRVIHEKPIEPPPSFDLGHALEAALRVLPLEVEASRARITFQSMPLVRGHQTQLSLVFQNLLSNAMKYSHNDRAPHIQISAEQHGTEHRIRVQDNGMGFDPKYAERVFELFQRLGNGDKPGTGLGLAISRRIIERHGGRMWAESELGKGSSFLFTLPVEKKEQ